MVVETTGTKRQAETSVADIDPQSGDGAVVANLVLAHSGVGGELFGKVGCQSGTRVIAAPEVGALLAGVAGGSGSRHATIGSGMWARSSIGMSRLLTTTKSGPHESHVHRRTIRDVDTGKVVDDCIPELVADEKVFRELQEKRTSESRSSGRTRRSGSSMLARTSWRSTARHASSRWLGPGRMPVRDFGQCGRWT